MIRKQNGERRVKIIVVIVLSITLLAGCTGCVTVEKVENSAKPTIEGEMGTVANTEKEKSTNNIASTIRFQDDFYGAINQKTLDGYELTYKDAGAGAAYEMQDVIDEEILTMIQQIVTSDKKYEEGSSEAIVKNAYEQTLQFLKDKKSNAGETFTKLKNGIQAAKNIKELQFVIKDIAKYQGLLLYFKPTVAYNYFNGDTYALYFNQVDTVAGMPIKGLFEKEDDRKALHSYAQRLLVELGEDQKTAVKKADQYVYFVLDIAAKTDYSIMETENPYICYKFNTEAQLNQLLKKIEIADIEDMYGINNPYDGWYVQDEEQFKMISSKFTNENLETIKTFLLCEIAMEYKDFLADSYPILKMYANSDSVKKEMAAMSYVSQLYSSEVSELYAKYYFTETMERDLHKMYDDIVQSYDDLISNASWLSEDARKGLLKKLHNMVFVCGGVKKTVKHDIEIVDDPFDTYCNAKKALVTSLKNKLGTKIDKSEPIMDSHILNSAYSPVNTFTITVAIAHAPYYDEKATYEENLGGLGMVMAHEMGHAFDSLGLSWDENGVYHPDWIGKENQEILKSRLKQMEEYYSSFTIMDIYHIDGELTSGENYADVGAMECLTNIVKEKDARKRMFENYAKIWCELTLDTEAVELLSIDEHSPAMIRTNAVLSANDAFYDSYDVKVGDGMYRAPNERVSRWK